MPRSVFAALISLPSSCFLTRSIGIVKVSLAFGLWSSVFGFVIADSTIGPKTKGPRPKSKNPRSITMCVAEWQRHLTVNQADVIVLRRFESYHMDQNFLQGCRLTGKPSVSRIEVFSSNLNVLAKFRKVARGGAQLVLKTRPSIASRGFNSFAFRQLWKRRLTVWQHSAKVPGEIL